ncbi:hypothetical protein QPK32_25185 [Massilia sp. YIM B02763]|uniref:hypothetical protein n=1 Tax=Massilia sp. YIM B02763 TaxID=3050130 RepID=UPI0025B72126|nr:hypothetical protein [Massilia sp. YIM B02763]MDN4056366.1 hypothetical protein [Massilia sp. YIM B02763]
MPTNCIGCRRFTVKERVQHDRTDKQMRAQGMGRCLQDPDPARYYPATRERDCEAHDPLQPAQVQQRTAYLNRHRA